MDPTELIDGAYKLLAGDDEPHAGNLRRAISNAYYALFHTVCRQIAETFVSSDLFGETEAWRLFYRALNHGDAKKVCQSLISLKSTDRSLAEIAATFVKLQQERHDADYAWRFEGVTRQDVLLKIENANRAITALHLLPAQTRSDFLARLVLKERR